MPRPAAIFDLDGTLLADTSAERLFIQRVLSSGVVPLGSIVSGFGRALAVFVRGGISTPWALKGWLRGAACAPVEALGVQCVHTDVVPRLRPELLSELAAHRQRGSFIILLTGTLDFLGMEVASHIGADAVAAARLERHEGRFTGRILEPYPHGVGKLRALEELSRLHDLDLAASHAWANRGSDIAHLERVGFAHAVAPNGKLRRCAEQRGWSIQQ
jgi:putative phosphoserine phosphatase/1-acylglycerol-3-phosphate O-acyltransferase